jgi:pSer/pThr/pTyr-binding forkhead associated (FHA) protein
VIQAYTDYLRDASSLSEEEFFSAHPHWVLVVEPFASVEVSAYATRAAAPERGHDRGVAPLTKRPNSNAFKLMVTIGRSKNSDVEIPCDDVSKFHAYVLNNPKEDTPQFADAGSTFGTEIDGERLEPRVPTSLVSGMQIRIGSVRAVCYSPRGFREHLLERPS